MREYAFYCYFLQIPASTNRLRVPHEMCKTKAMFILVSCKTYTKNEKTVKKIYKNGNCFKTTDKSGPHAYIYAWRRDDKIKNIK